MALPIKERLGDVRSLRACALRDAGLDRLYKVDVDEIVDLLNKLEAKIVSSPDRTKKGLKW